MSSCIALVALAAAALAHDASAQCLGDLNGDRKVSGADIGILLGFWGLPGEAVGADLDGNGIVSGSDLGLLLGAWGPCAVVPEWATLVEAQPDPSVITSPSLRAAIVATGLAWRVRDAATQIEMLLVPPGGFRMGCSASSYLSCDDDENPKHDVTLTNPFYLGRYEVTQAQWLAHMGSNPSGFQLPSPEVPPDRVPDRPVERVSWVTVQGYLAETSFRLPSEAEWEFACRGGTDTAFSNGSNLVSSVDDLAWSYLNSGGQTRPVGGKRANPLGFFDMHGNVWEWTGDWHGPYPAAPQVNPEGPATGTSRVVRGGSWGFGSDLTRSSNRYPWTHTHASYYVGFRVARNP